MPPPHSYILNFTSLSLSLACHWPQIVFLFQLSAVLSPYFTVLYIERQHTENILLKFGHDLGEQPSVVFAQEGPYNSSEKFKEKQMRSCIYTITSRNFPPSGFNERATSHIPDGGVS